MKKGFILSQSGGSEGLGFAAPSNIVRRVYEQILQYGRVRRGAIGARVQTVTPELADGLGLPQDWGVILADVYPAGPAATAGLRVGDIVLTLDGKPMENARQFEVNLYPRGVGETVRVEVLRGDQRAVYTVSPVERPGDPDRFQQMARPAQHLVSRLGILGLTLTADVSSMLLSVGGLRPPSTPIPHPRRKIHPSRSSRFVSPTGSPRDHDREEGPWGEVHDRARSRRSRCWRWPP